MHSFAPFLSFLISVFLLPLEFQASTFARAAELGHTSVNFAARNLTHLRHSSHRRNHGEVGHVARSDLILYPGRRAANAKFTYFKTGLGACGNFNQPSDFIVALNMQQYDVDSHCGAAITIRINGKTAHATIADRCVGCGYNNLDMTAGLYAFFDPSMDGTLYGEWEYGDGAPEVTTTKKPTPTPTPTPTSTKTTTTFSTTTTSSKVKTTSSTTPVPTSTTSTSAVTTTSVAPFQSEVPVVAGNIEQVYLALLGMSSIVMGGLDSSN